MPDPIEFTVREITFVSGFGEWTYGLTENTGKRCWHLDCSRDLTTDDAETAGDLALAALPVARGDPYTDGDTSRFCEKITIKALQNDPSSLYAEAEFGAQQWQENPLLRKDKISLEVGGETETWFVDSKGKPSVNSVGEILDKIPPRTTGGVNLVITGNRSVLPAVAMIGLSRPSHINTAAMTIRGLSIGTGQAKLVGCSGDEQTENGVTFYVVKWKLSLAPSWQLKVDDYGFKFKSGSLILPIVEGDGKTPIKKPWPLNGSGAKKPNATDAAAQLTFDPYTDGDLSTFSWTSAA